MPLTPPGIIGALIPNLIATGNIGPAMPQLAAGIAAGVMIWIAQAKVVTVDVGTLGGGTGIVPCIVPPPLLIGGMLVGYAAFGNIGPMAVPNAIGVANGLTLAFPQGSLITTHPGVGMGAGLAKVVGSSAIPAMIGGFASAGMAGPGSVKIASSIGMGIDIAFSTFTIPFPIVGPPNIAPGAGVGFGTII